MKTVSISIEMELANFIEVSIENMSSLVQIMACRWAGDRLLYGPLVA